MTKDKTQLLYIHGGMTFNSKEKYIDYLKTRNLYLEDFKIWSGDYLRESLAEHCMVIGPKMPRKEFSQYDEWKIDDEKLLDTLDIIFSPMKGKLYDLDHF